MNDVAQANPIGKPAETVQVTVALPAEAIQVTHRPIAVSQGNCLAAIGVSTRVWLDMIPELERDGVAIIRRGKVRAVLACDLERWLRERGTTRAAPNTSAVGADLAERLGLRILPASRARRAGS